MFHVTTVAGVVMSAHATQRDAVVALLSMREEGDPKWASVTLCEDPSCEWCRAVVRRLRQAVYAVAVQGTVVSWPVCPSCAHALADGDDGVTVRRVRLADHRRAEACDACGVELVPAPALSPLSAPLPPGNRWEWVL